MKRYALIAIYKGYGTILVGETNSIIVAAYKLLRLFQQGQGYEMAIVKRR